MLCSSTLAFGHRTPSPAGPSEGRNTGMPQLIQFRPNTCTQL